MKHLRTAAGAFAAAVASLTLAATPASADHGGAHCPDIADVNIVPGHPQWDPALDNDNDLVACEDPNRPHWTPPGPDPTTPPGDVPPTTGTTVTEPAPAPPPEAPPVAAPAAPVVEEPDYTG